MFRLPSQKKFAPKPGPKRASIAPQPSARVPGSQATQASQIAPLPSSQPIASGSQLPESTLVPPGISQVIDARLLENSAAEDAVDLSQSATQVDNAGGTISKATTLGAATHWTKTITPTADAIDSRLLDDTSGLLSSPETAKRPLAKENAGPAKRTTRNTKSPEIAKRASPPAPLQTAAMLPPPSSPRPKAKSALLQAAQNNESSVQVYHRGKRAGSRASSRAGSRNLTASPAPSLPETPSVDLSMLLAEVSTDVAPEVTATETMEPVSGETASVATATAKRKPPAPRRKREAAPQATESTFVRENSGMPPTLGTAQQTEGMPIDPTLASEPTEEPAPQPAPRMRGRKVAGTVRQAPPRPRKLRAAPSADPADVTQDDTEINIDPPLEAGPSSRPVSRPRRTARAAPKKQRVEREDTRSDPGSEYADETEEGSVSSGTTRKRKRKSFQLASYETGEAQPGEMLGVEIDDTALLKDLLGVHGSDGRISVRGIEVAAFRKERQKKKQRENEAASEEAWKHRQVMRRQARAVKNAAKEERRQAAREAGEGSDGVSADELDSGDEFEHVPERLTPPSSPEPGAEDEEGGDAPPEDADEVEEGEGEDEEGEEPLFLPAEEDEAPPEEPEEEDADLAALRAAGFIVRADGDPLPEDEEELGDFDPEQMSFDEYQALMERHEANRLQRLENAQAREVVEEDRVQMVNSNSFSKKKRVRNEKWSDEETDFFYHVLGEVGENYGLMAHYFPGRTMNQVKRKGVRENKADPARVTAAIYSKKRMDVSYLRKTVAYDTDAPMDKERRFIQEVIAESERMKKEDSIASLRLNGDEPAVAEGDEGEGAQDDEEEVEGEVGDDENAQEDEDMQDVDEEMIAA